MYRVIHGGDLGKGRKGRRKGEGGWDMYKVIHGGDMGKGRGKEEEGGYNEVSGVGYRGQMYGREVSKNRIQACEYTRD